MDWIAVGTLGVSLVAAIAAVWAAVVSRQQLRFAIHATAPEPPLIEAVASAVEGQPDWTDISVVMRNRAAIPVDLLSVRVLRPKGTRLLLNALAHESSGGEWEAGPMRDPLPADLAAATVPQRGYMNRAGTTGQHGPGPADMFTVYAHSPISRFMEQREPRLILEMRWRDHTTKTFEMAVNVIKPNTA